MYGTLAILEIEESAITCGSYVRKIFVASKCEASHVPVYSK